MLRHATVKQFVTDAKRWASAAVSGEAGRWAMGVLLDRLSAFSVRRSENKNGWARRFEMGPAIASLFFDLKYQYLTEMRRGKVIQNIEQHRSHFQRFTTEGR